MPILTPDDVIVVSEESRLSSDPYDIIQSNLDFVNALFAERAAAIPDRAAREARAQAAEPRYRKLIRALCAKAGQQLQTITAGDPTFSYQGQRMLAWHFLTDHGHFYMADLGNKAIMFDNESGEKIAEIEAPPEPAH